MSSTASSLSELSGLDGAKRAALRLCQPGAGGHAVLLYGAEGAGKKKLAEALAKAWLCTDPTAEGACGECGACQSYDRGRTPDLLCVEPRGSSNIIHLRAFIETTPEMKEYEAVMPLLDFFRTPPLSSRSKVGLIVSADRMNAAAANAFLKTLEEPHPYVRVVMTSSSVGQILPTILSRCVCVACELPTTEVQADIEAIMAEGAPGRLEHIQQHSGPYQRIAQVAERLGATPPSHALALAEEFRSACAELEDSLKCGARFANVEALRALGACVAVSRREHSMAAIAEAHRRVLGNANMALVTDALFARLAGQ
jgi:hypothetical protein